mmetsp:Transcript_38199/g.61847  ORF Transcript_38199/g.61847 Transcript_38199/m.61847 type:complete len:590 (+) Transcript_38199:81-1850(+)
MADSEINSDNTQAEAQPVIQPQSEKNSENQGGWGWGGWAAKWVAPVLTQVKTSQGFLREAAADIGSQTVSAAKSAYSYAKEASQSADKAAELLLGATVMPDPDYFHKKEEDGKNADEKEDAKEGAGGAAQEDEVPDDKSFEVLQAIDKGFTLIDRSTEKVYNAVKGSVQTVHRQATQMDLNRVADSSMQMSARAVETTKSIVQTAVVSGMGALDAFGKRAERGLGAVNAMSKEALRVLQQNAETAATAAMEQASHAMGKSTSADSSIPNAPRSTGSSRGPIVPKQTSRSMLGDGFPVDDSTVDTDFEQSYERYQGTRFVKNLESLASECDSRVRAKTPDLSTAQKAALDATFTTIDAVFHAADLSVSNALAPEIAAALASSSADLLRNCQDSPEGKEMASLSKEGKERAKALVQEFQAELDRVTGSGKQAIADLAMSYVDKIRTESIRRLASYASRGVSQLLNVAEVATDPSSPSQQKGAGASNKSTGVDGSVFSAALSRRWVQFLSDEISSLASAYMAAVREVAAFAKTAGASASGDSDAALEAIEDKMYSTTTDIYLDSGTASSNLQENLPLLYRVCKGVAFTQLLR